jgi:predicted GNAT family acetyltransferase
MSDSIENVVVENNEAAKRFEARVAGEVAFIQYRYEKDRIVMVHTDVPPSLGGRGLAGKLAHAALEYARTAGLKVVPLCPYVASYIRKHPEYQSLVHQG